MSPNLFQRLKIFITISLFSFCFVSIFFSSSCYSGHKSTKNVVQEYDVLTTDSPYYKELMPIAIKWMNALVNKDIDALVFLAAPEAKTSVRAELLSKRSDLYHLFYDDEWNRQRGRRSVCDFLKNARQLKIVLVKEKLLAKFGHGTSVYYYDSSRVKPTFPLSDKEEGKLLNNSELWQMFFYKIGSEWYASYELFQDGE